MQEERRQLEGALDRGRTAVSYARVEGDRRSVADEDVTVLALHAQRGDGRARERLIVTLLPLISSWARRYATDGLDRDDLLQEGVVGLLRALDRFDGTRGVAFTAFAAWWIRRALQDARSDFIRPLRLPPKALRQLSQLKSEHQRIYQQERRSAGIAELAERTEIDVAQAEALVRADAGVRSLDETPERERDAVGSLGDLLADPLSAAAYEDVIDTVAGEQLHTLLSRLTDRERAIVRARFGFDGPTETLTEIGQRFGLSAERVRQVEERALAKLRHGR